MATNLTNQSVGFLADHRRRAARPAFGQRVGRALAAVRTIGQHRAAANELASLSDRELADIGLNRGDLGRVLDPEFAEEFASRG